MPTPLTPPPAMSVTNTRERILAMGGAGMGKTHAFFTIAKAAVESGSDARFYVIDTDESSGSVLLDPTFRSLWNEDMTSLHNVEIRRVSHWEELLSTLNELQGALVQGKFITKGLLRSQDWLMIDLLSPTWQWVQDWYTMKVFDKGLDDFFMQQREAMKPSDKKMSGLEGWKDYCVDEDTEILTQRGWLRCDDLTTDDMALTLNESTWQAQFEPVLAVNKFPARSRDMVSIEMKSHSSLTTDDHRWLVRNMRDGRVEWTTSGTMNKYHRVRQVAPRSDLPTEHKWTDAFVEMVAWYWTEGWINKRDRPSLQGGVAQSSTVNPAKCDRIRSCLRSVFGETGWTELSPREDGVITWRLNAPVMALLEEVAPDKVVTWEFLNSLTEAQLRLFIDTSIDGDGHRTLRGQVSWVQKDQRRLDAMQYACTLAGIASRAYMRPTGKIGAVELLRSGGVWPANNGDYRKTVQHDGIVWCPTTPSGTWLARRHGTVYFTGNTVINPQYGKLQDRILRSPGNLYATAEVKALNADQVDKETRMMFGPYGVTPVGQKRTPHLFSTILWFTSMTVGGRELVTIKDRGRALLQGQPIDNFAVDYLKNIAGWQFGKTAEEVLAEAMAKRDAAK